LHDPVPHGRDAEAAAFSVRLGDHPFPHGKRLEAPGFEIVSKLGEHPVAEEDGVRFHSVHPS